jgi:hypothetical protein
MRPASALTHELECGPHAEVCGRPCSTRRAIAAARSVRAHRFSARPRIAPVDADRVPRAADPRAGTVHSSHLPTSGAACRRHVRRLEATSIPGTAGVGPISRSMPGAAEGAADEDAARSSAHTTTFPVDLPRLVNDFRRLGLLPAVGAAVRALPAPARRSATGRRRCAFSLQESGGSAGWPKLACDLVRA